MHAKLRAIGTKLLGGTPRTNKRFPIAILSFNRPHYLREVLLSLRPQVDEDDRITLFQDGAWNPYSKQRRTHPAHIAVCVGLFREIIPWGTVAESKYNIGVAENYERAEQQIFRRWREPCGLFLEDDMVLSPNYLAVTKMLLDIAQKEPRISYVSAYGDLRASVAEQEARPRDLIPMHENWGFEPVERGWTSGRSAANTFGSSEAGTTPGSMRMRSGSSSESAAGATRSRPRTPRAGLPRWIAARFA